MVTREQILAANQATFNRGVEVRGATFSEFADDNLVARDTHYVDVASLLHQLGLG